VLIITHYGDVVFTASVAVVMTIAILNMLLKGKLMRKVALTLVAIGEKKTGCNT
jgi:hypothetical protein